MVLRGAERIFDPYPFLFQWSFIEKYKSVTANFIPFCARIIDCPTFTAITAKGVSICGLAIPGPFSTKVLRVWCGPFSGGRCKPLLEGNLFFCKHTRDHVCPLRQLGKYLYQHLLICVIAVSIIESVAFLPLWWCPIPVLLIAKHTMLPPCFLWFIWHCIWIGLFVLFSLHLERLTLFASSPGELYLQQRLKLLTLNHHILHCQVSWPPSRVWFLPLGHGINHFPCGCCCPRLLHWHQNHNITWID